MKVKHSKLIIGILLLVGLMLLPMVAKPMVVERSIQKQDMKYYPECVAAFSYDPLGPSKDYIRRTLRTSYSQYVPENHVDWWAQTIANATDTFGVPEEKMIAMLYVESKFNPHLKKKGGMVGPSQIVSGVWKNTLSKKFGYNLYDPDDNVMAGAYVLNDYKEQCGNWDCALRAYNVGIGAYQRGSSKAQERIYMLRINTQLALLESSKKRNKARG